MAPKAMIPAGGGRWRRKSRRAPRRSRAATTVRMTEPSRGWSHTVRARRTGAAFDQRSTSSLGATGSFTSSAGAVREDGGIRARPLAQLEATAAVHRRVGPVVAVDRRRLVGAPEHLALVVQARVVALGRGRVGVAQHLEGVEGVAADGSGIEQRIAD